MNSFDIIKIIHGSSLSAGNTFKKETTSHNTEYIEAFALNQEMKYLSEAYALSGEEKSLIQVCMQLYNLLQNESISVDRRVSILHSLKKACFRFSKIRAENERRIAETGSLDDKSWLLFNGIKTPYYTVNESKRSLYQIDITVAGEEDPFYDGFRELYGDRGIRGYRDAHPESFGNVRNSWIKNASRRYVKEEYVPLSIKKIIGAILALVVFILVPDLLRVYPGPINILVVLGIWVSITGILCFGDMYRTKVNSKIFGARLRIGIALGIIKEGRWYVDGTCDHEDSLAAIYVFDYGYNIDPDADSSARDSLICRPDEY